MAERGIQCWLWLKEASDTVGESTVSVTVAKGLRRGEVPDQVAS